MAKPLHQTELHKKKLKKNLTVLAMIIGFFIIVWAVTMIKIASV